MKDNNKSISCLILAVLILSPFSVFAQAETATSTPPVTADANPASIVNLDLATINKGYTVSGFNNALRLSLVPGILSGPTQVEIVKITDEMPAAWKLDRLSNVFQFEFKNKAAYDNHKPFYIQFAYDKASNYRKTVYFFDKGQGAWRPLPTMDFPDRGYVRSVIHLPFARIAVFADPAEMAIGKASWYRHKTGLFAASPDYPIGSRLRVWRIDDNSQRFVDVTVNDFGPDRKAHPDRVVDLERTAFEWLAPASEGTIKVRIEPINIAKPGAVVAAPTAKLDGSVSDKPDVTARAALVMDEASGKVLYEKNADAQMPIASLSKMIAAYVFLSTDPDLNMEVAYSIKDEEYNYEHCEKWESARLKVDDGETMTVKDLIHASLVGSANNTVESFVRVSGLTRPDFIKKMNETAADWGAKSTRFVEPTGLAPANVSTARDYAIMVKEVLKNPIIAKASAMPSYVFSTINTKEQHTLKNTDSLVRAGQLEISGSKTGYLHEALYCLMVRAKAANGRRVIVVTLGAGTKSASASETEALIKYSSVAYKNIA